MSFKIDVSSLVLEFLEAAIHQLLYVKRIYPEAIFVAKKKYGVPIHVSVYPTLNQYIQNTLSSVKFVLEKDELHQLDVCFYAADNTPTEKVVFYFDTIRSGSHDMGSDDPYLIQMRETFRAFCLKLSVSTSYTKPLPEGSTFKFCLHTTESMSYIISEDPGQKQFPWYVAESKEVTLNDSTITPIRTVEHEFMTMHIYSEESSRKE